MAFTASKLLAIAAEEVGYLEKKTNAQLDSKTANAGRNNYTKYARDLFKAGFFNGNKNGFPWCTSFVVWLFWILCNKDKEKALKMTFQAGPYGASCKYAAGYYRKAGRFYKSPKVGDQIFFGPKGAETHTGIVYHVSDKYVYTIEGNTSGASGVVANGGGVCRKQYALSYNEISGYGRPQYDKEPAASSSSASGTNRIDTVREVQKWLNSAYSAGLDTDNDYGKKTKAALVKALQKELGFTGKAVDGIFGPKTKAAVKTLKPGSKGALVKILQALLVCNGYKKAYVDGSYGPGTEDAVTNYQSQKGLKPDGEAGENTFAALCA